MDTHPSARLLKAISDYDIKFVQRLLYDTPSDLWLSDKDKDWHYPLLITLRAQDRMNWGNKSIEAWRKDEIRPGKKDKTCKGTGGPSRALPSAWGSGQGYWQAALGAYWGASQWRGAEGADVTRERAMFLSLK